MHEFSLVQRILQTCINTAIKYQANQIKTITLLLGDFSLVVEELMIQAFNIATNGTIAEDAEIIMNRTPGVIKCNSCMKKSEIWFENVWKSENFEIKEKLEDYKEHLEANEVLEGTAGFGVNIFQCVHCGSKDTDLVDGKKIIIKNIKVD